MSEKEKWSRRTSSTSLIDMELFWFFKLFLLVTVFSNILFYQKWLILQYRKQLSNIFLICDIFLLLHLFIYLSIHLFIWEQALYSSGQSRLTV